MSELFFIGCTHFGHNNMYKFVKEDGSRVRAIAENASDGDAIMIENWNKTVTDKDKVFVMGDVAIPRFGLTRLEQLKGRKHLVKGNHDIFKLKDYAKHFEDIHADIKVDKFFCTHRPSHPDSIPRWALANIHAHIHNSYVLKPDGSRDYRYFNTCVEVIDYTPISFDEIKKTINEWRIQNECN